MPEYTLQELTPEEMESLSNEMQELLAKYNCEMAVRSSIEIMKRVPVTKEAEFVVADTASLTPDEFIPETTEEAA